MTDVFASVRFWDRKNKKNLDSLFIKNADGTYSQVIHSDNSILSLNSDLKVGAKSLTLTLTTGAGSVPIPDTCTVVGVKPATGAALRVGLEAPEADGTKTGDAAAGDLKKGIPVDAETWTWFNVGLGTSRTLYVKGSAAEVLAVAVM